MDALFIVYSVMLAAATRVGLFMTLPPRRFGNLLHENYLIFPSVGPRDRVKTLLLRAAGVGLIAFATHIAPRLLALMSAFS